MPRREAGREKPLVPFAGHDAAAAARQFLGEVLAPGLLSRPTVAVKPGRDAEDLNDRVMFERPGRKGDRGQVRLQMARRHVDDQPADPALAHRRLPARPALEGGSGDRRP